MRIREARTGALIAPRARMARGFVQRAVGLLGRARLQEGEALILERCGSIHTCFMRFSIDAVFLAQGRIVQLARWLGPFRLAAARGADTVLELPAGTIDAAGLVCGGEIVLDEGPFPEALGKQSGA